MKKITNIREKYLYISLNISKEFINKRIHVHKLTHTVRVCLCVLRWDQYGDSVTVWRSLMLINYKHRTETRK